MLPEIRTSIPGPKSLELARRLRQVESQNITFLSSRFPVFWDRARGVNVWDVDGNRYLDFTSGFAVASLGHCNQVVCAAALAQIDRLAHAMGDVHPTEQKVELCELLSAITFERWNKGPGKTILTNSGSEAVEAALKTALMYTGRPKVISFSGAYHGLGHGALAISGLEYFRNPFRSQLAELRQTIPFPSSVEDLEATRRALERTLDSTEIGAIIVEPIQGRGGDIVPPTGFLALLRHLADEAKVLLIFDEIYTGFYRTGTFFACDAEGVVPDIICLGKALTSGFPLSACVARADVMDAWPPSAGEALHTSTFLGHPVGCAMACASIHEHLAPQIATQVAKASKALDDALNTLDSAAIGQIRGRGLMRGIELVTPEGLPWSDLAGAIVLQALQDGILVLAGSPNNNVLSLSPPFSVQPDESGLLAAKLQEYLTSLPGSISKSIASRSDT